MKTSTFFKQSILFIAIGLATAVATAQTILTADNNPGSTAAYTSVQAAHDAAAAGDIIYVQPSSISYGSLSITKAISIVGRSHSEPSKVSTVGGITIASSDVIIKGLNIGTLNSIAGGTPPYENIEIYENKIASTFYLGFQASDATDSVLIQGNQISAFTQYDKASNILLVNNIFTSTGPLFSYDAASLVVSNNIFRFTSSCNLYNYSAGIVNFSNNMFLNNRGADTNITINNGIWQVSNNLFHNFNPGFTLILAPAAAASVTESNSLYADPQFTSVDATNTASMAGTSTLNFAANTDDLTLQAGSPALTGGSSGSEIGILHNGFNYKYYGNPRGIPAVDIITYDSTVPANGTINATITAKAH